MASYAFTQYDANPIGVCTAPSITVSGGRTCVVSAAWELGYPAADGTRIFGCFGSTNASGISKPILVTREGVVMLQDQGAGITAGQLVNSRTGGFVGNLSTELLMIGSGLVANNTAIGWAMETITASGYGPVALFGID